MKKYKVVVQNAAKDDIREARNWYNKQLLGLGKKAEYGYDKYTFENCSKPYFICCSL